MNTGCATAINEYQSAEARIGRNDPEALSVAAARAVADAAASAARVPAPDISRSTFVTQLRALAVAQGDMARAVRLGSVDEEMAALDAVRAAGATVSASATPLGLPQCSAMTSKV